jgi:hypothetical protein
MNITTITKSVPACYGVCCLEHGECTRYAAVEETTAELHFIATCDDGTGTRPLFQAIQREAVAA